MNDSSNLKDNPTVLKCKITVTKNGNGFDAKYDPEIIKVNLNNTDIHFHIDAQSSDDVEIDTVTITPDGQTQLIDQQISTSRQQFKLKDLNTLMGKFILSFHYKDKHSAKSTAVMAKCSEGDQGLDVPQIENNPPG